MKAFQVRVMGETDFISLEINDQVLAGSKQLSHISQSDLVVLIGKSLYNPGDNRQIEDILGGRRETSTLLLAITLYVSRTKWFEQVDSFNQVFDNNMFVLFMSYRCKGGKFGIRNFGTTKFSNDHQSSVELMRLPRMWKLLKNDSVHSKSSLMPMIRQFAG
jgi:hypothetical protein